MQKTSLLIAAVLSLAATPAFAQNIDTRATATNTLAPFGYPTSQTYGQTFTVPAGQNAVSSFSFKLASVGASITFRGVLMRWDTVNSRAIGPVLYQSSDFNTTGATAQDATFTIPGSAAVTAGQTYVIFGSTVNSAGSGAGSWSRTGTDVLPGGNIVYQNAGSQSDWTGTPWDNFAGDFGVTVNFAAAPAAAPVPTLSEWAMILFGTILAGGAALYIQRRQMTV